MDARSTFEANVERIGGIVAAVARRHGLSPDETDDFRSRVHEKLIRDDYAVIRKFRGDASLPTYLVTVIAKEFLDYRVACWGRWRPSMAARRLGEHVVLLERLIYREGHPVREAIEVLRSRRSDLPSETDLMRLAAGIPQRSNPRKTVELSPPQLAGQAADRVSSPAPELGGVRSEAEESLQEALATLPAEDQMIVRLHFWERMNISDVARVLHLDQKRLYRRMTKNLKRLRSFLEERGVDRDMVREYLDESPA